MRATGSCFAKILITAGVISSLLASAPALAEKPAPDSWLAKEKILFCVGYAHLDTQWRWTYVDTIDKYIPATMRDNFALFEKFPDYIFNFSGANRYRMMKEYYPADYARVKEYVAKGRWFPCGSSMEESDVNVPSAESLIRQVMLGNHFFRKEFGKASAEYMLPDCFGFPASLPSILAHCGVRGFSTQKLTWRSAMGIPFSIGVWEGLDGKSVIAALNPGEYVGQVRGDLTSDPVWVKRVMENGEKYGLYTDYHYYGVGDRGGAPTESSVQWIEKSLKGSGPIKVASAEADAMFKAITPEQEKKLPRYKGDLLLIEHSAGSISSQAYMKRWNRKNELLADAAERASVAAQWLGGLPWPRKKMNDAWTLVMGGQFHDILPGTSVPKAYEYAWNDQILAQNQFAEIARSAVGAVARALDTQGEGQAMVVYNPLSIEREDVVEAYVTLAGTAQNIEVIGPDGKAVPNQLIGFSKGRFHFIFLARVPAAGFAVYDVRPAAATVQNPELKAAGNTIENARYKVQVADSGDVASIFDKTANKELLASPMRMAFQYSNPSQYPAWNVDWNDARHPPRAFVDGPAKITLVENGPVRVALQIEREAQGSKFIQRVRLAAGECGNRVEFLDSIDWKTTSSLLKATFPLSVANPLATYNWELGTVQRGNNEEKKFEVPTHEWLDLTDKAGDYGVTVLTDCKYGSDKPADNTVRLTLLYTPGVRAGYPDEATQDWGRHEILYGLAGHKGGWQGTHWQGLRLNQPMLVFGVPKHAGQLGKTFSLASVSAPGVIVNAIKLAEDNEDVIVRLIETEGKETKSVELKLAGPIAAAREVNGQELPLGEGRVRDGKLVTDLGPYGVRAFALRLGQAPATVKAPKSAPVDLTYDKCVASKDGGAATDGFDEQRIALTAEMLPDKLEAEGVTFKLGPRDGKRPNAVACAGQTIALPQGDYNRLYLLAAAHNGDAPAVFKAGDAQINLTIQDWGGFIGQWFNRVWNDERRGDLKELQPGFIKPATVAWYSSHRHDAAGRNQAYAYSYLYKYGFDIPAGLKSLTLPANPRIKVLAISVAREEGGALPLYPLLDTIKSAGFDGKAYAYKAQVPAPRGRRPGKKTTNALP